LTNSDDLETQIETFLSKITINERFKDWCLKYLNELNDDEVEARNASIKALQEAYSGCVKRLDNLLQLKISAQNSDNSLLTNEEFKSQKSAIISEKILLEERLANAGERIDSWMETAVNAFNFAVHVRHNFETGDADTKREILVAIGSNLILKDGLLHLDAKKPYCFLEEIIKTEPTTSQMLEPVEQNITTLQLEDSWAQNQLVLPR